MHLNIEYSSPSLDEIFVSFICILQSFLQAHIYNVIVNHYEYVIISFSFTVVVKINQNNV